MATLAFRRCALLPSSCARSSVGKILPGSIRTKSEMTSSQPRHIAAQLDFRTFIDVLREDGDLAEIEREVDPHLEVGAIVRRVSEVNGKAPLFNNVKGTKDGLWRMFGNAASLRSREEEKYGRIARSLGLPVNASWKAILERTQEAKSRPPLPPRVLSTGPCKQNRIFQDDIDLHKLPAPMLHQRDGGKYLQTYGLHVLQTPDASWTNWSIFRGMIHDSRRLVCLVGSGQHNSIIRDKWLAEGKTEMPWALAMGVPPAASLAAASPIPEGVSEGEYVGALVGQPLDMVKLPGRITDESHTTASLASEELLMLLKQHNLPITDAFAPLETMATWCALQVDIDRLAEMKTDPKEFCDKLARIAFNNKSCMLINRILLFGHDVDVRNFKDIIWALVTRCRPGQDEYLFDDVPSFPMTPYMSHGRGDAKRGGKVISDCLFPMEYEGKREFSGVDFERSYPEHVKDKVRSNWTSMGFDSV
ncbi:Carboxylyase-related [Fusarium albosuccineum]|uniref:Ferulic acid decarboxylase 1 n=1 Tax=Fusarium albosuccineum TaxID=1237068 RepID=A0A8H4KX78_9HYPO|nr:Carboxylyase-related [Fusarium albosuccineum]